MEGHRILDSLSKWSDSVNLPCLPAHMQYMSALLGCTVQPAAALTPGELQAAGIDCTPNPGGDPDSQMSHGWMGAERPCRGNAVRR